MILVFLFNKKIYTGNTEIRTWYPEQINSQFSFLSGCPSDFQKTGELLDSSLLLQIDEAIKKSPQEVVLGPGGAAGVFFIKTLA